MANKPLFGYLVSHPIQYQAPFFRRLANSHVIDFVALFGSDFGVRPTFDPQFGRVVDFGIDLLSGYRSRFLEQAAGTPDIDRFFGLRTRSMRTAWQTESVDVVALHGWRTAMMWQAAAGAVLSRRPYLMRAETPAFSADANRSKGVGRARDMGVGLLVRKAAAVLALGSANARFYRQLGFPPERIHRVPYFVDNAAVAEAAAKGRMERNQLRAQLGIPLHSYVMVGVAKLLPRKRPLDMVRVLPGLPTQVHLVWVGSGEMEQAVRAEAALLGVASRVHLPGFRSAEETWRILGVSDLFVMPSENEPWGLAINEAVAAGLPALVSEECGAAEDLVVRDRTGEILRVGDLSSWTSAVERWYHRAAAGDRGDTGHMKRRADAHSIDCAATATEEAVLAVTSSRQSRNA